MDFSDDTEEQSTVWDATVAALYQRGKEKSARHRAGLKLDHPARAAVNRSKREWWHRNRGTAAPVPVEAP